MVSSGVSIDVVKRMAKCRWFFSSEDLIPSDSFAMDTSTRVVSRRFVRCRHLQECDCVTVL